MQSTPIVQLYHIRPAQLKPVRSNDPNIATVTVGPSKPTLIVIEQLVVWNPCLDAGICKHHIVAAAVITIVHCRVWITMLPAYVKAWQPSTYCGPSRTIAFDMIPASTLTTHYSKTRLYTSITLQWQLQISALSLMDCDVGCALVIAQLHLLTHQEAELKTIIIQQT